MQYIQSSSVNNNDIFLTTGSWQLYVVGVGNSIFPATFTISAWVITGTAPTTPTIKYPAPNLIT